MPGIGSIWGRGAAGLRSHVRAGTMRTAKAMGRIQAQRVGGRIPRTALMGSGAAWDLSVMTARMLGRGAGRTLNWTGKHPFSATIIGLGITGGLGGIRGAMSSQMATYPVPRTNQPLQGIQGPGYNTWGSPSKGRMQPGNMGATGDLTLAMHKRRHR